MRENTWLFVLMRQGQEQWKKKLERTMYWELNREEVPDKEKNISS